MRLIYEGYDISPAVKNRKKMLFEKWRGNASHKKNVWDPARQFLLDVGKLHPKQMNCFFGLEFHFSKNNKQSLCRDIFIINQAKEVAYLCTAFNKAAWQEYLDTICEEPEYETVARLKPLYVVRDPIHYIVPTGTKAIDELVVITCIKAYLESHKEKVISSLADVAICLFSAERGATLEGEINRQAELLAEKP